jgi:hypothetical protein
LKTITICTDVVGRPQKSQQRYGPEADQTPPSQCSAVVAIQSVGIAIAAGGVLYHVQPGAMWVFIASSIAALLLLMAVHYNLAEWWFNQPSVWTATTGPL